MTNFCPSCPISQKPYSMWLSFMIHICKMTRYPSIFHFLKILIFWVVLIFWFDFLILGVTGQKIVQNDKKFWVSCSISLEPYIIWLSFMLHVCKMMKSLGVFVNFSKFWFYGSSGRGGWTKKIVCCALYSYISGIIHHFYDH